MARSTARVPPQAQPRRGLRRPDEKESRGAAPPPAGHPATDHLPGPGLRPPGGRRARRRPTSPSAGTPTTTGSSTTQGNQIVVKQGQQGGVLWFHPKVVDRSDHSTSDVPRLAAGRAPRRGPEVLAGQGQVLHQQPDHDDHHHDHHHDDHHDRPRGRTSVPSSRPPTTEHDRVDHDDRRRPAHHDHRPHAATTRRPPPALRTTTMWLQLDRDGGPSGFSSGPQRRLWRRCNPSTTRASTRAATRSPTCRARRHGPGLPGHRPPAR